MLHYRIILSGNFRFDNREKYSELIESYLEEKIDTLEFYRLFEILYFENKHVSRPIEEDLKKNSALTISVDSRAEKYSDLIDTIFYLNQRMLKPEEPEDEESDNEEDLNEAILQDHRPKTRETYLEMKQILQEE